MDAIGMSHIAICVRDMDKSLGFYRDILGMEVTFDGPTDPRKTRRRVSLSCGEGVPIPSLTLTSHPGEEPDGNPILLDQVGITHFSITVADVNALAEELISKGVEPAGPRESFINAEGKFRYIYVRDPDGILIQFDSGGAG